MSLTISLADFLRKKAWENYLPGVFFLAGRGECIYAHLEGGVVWDSLLLQQLQNTY